MELLLVRHGPAGERTAGSDDRIRPLTPEGAEKFERAARGLKTLVPTLELLVASPLVRARQTADVLGAAYGGLVPVETPLLEPGTDPEATVRWLRQQAKHRSIGLVGHEPHLGHLASYLLSGSRESFVVLKKGGACLLDVPREVEPGSARLHWFLKPGHLRGLRE